MRLHHSHRRNRNQIFPFFQNIVSATAACILQLGLYAPHRNDVLFSFLPLAHTMERCCELAVYMAGGAVGFYSGEGHCQEYQGVTGSIFKGI